MVKRPGRLYRKLKPTAPLFEFAYDDNLLTDDHIRSVTIHRGGEGVSPSTLELASTMFASVATGHMCSVSLTSSGNDLVNGLIGHSGSTRARRFTGRLGQQIVDDRGGSNWATTYLAASQSAQLSSVRKKYNFAAGTLVRDVIRTIMNPPSLPAYTVVNQAAAADYGTLREAITDQSYSDLISKFTTDLGILARETRDGNIQLQTHEFRHSRAVTNLNGVLPLARSQGLAPATWEQRNETRPRNFLLKYWNSANQLVQQVYGNQSDTLAEVIDLDMSHVRFTNQTQPEQEAFARRAREWLTAYAIPSVKVDLLHLMTSPKSYDRAQAGALLSLEPGTPMYFSGDWHPNLRGINYAEKLTETITPDSWEMDITLVPSQEVTGYGSVEIPARVWDQATYPWGTETRKWNEA